MGWRLSPLLIRGFLGHFLARRQSPWLLEAESQGGATSIMRSGLRHFSRTTRRRSLRNRGLPTLASDSFAICNGGFSHLFVENVCLD